MEYKIGMLLVLLSASMAAALPLADVAVLDKSFSDSPYAAHLMSLTFDGTNYWTITGGYGPFKVTKYDNAGNSIGQWGIDLDGRSVAYNQGDGKLYVKDYGTNSLYVLGNISGTDYLYAAVPGFTNKFQDLQSKIAISPDGQYVYDALNGNVRKYELSTGNNVENITLEGYAGGFPEAFQIGTDGTYLFALKNTTVMAYNMSGSFVKAIPGLANDLFYTQWSYSNTDNRIWVFDVANGEQNGVWKGYNIYGEEEPTNAPMFPMAAMPLGIMAASLVGAYRMARKD